MSESKVVGAIEIGTSKVVVLLGEVCGEEGLNIIGQSVASSRGVKKGVITDLQKASDCVHAAIAEVERNAHSRIDEVYLAQTGRHLRGGVQFGTANVGASDGIVRAADIEQAKEDAKRRKLPPDRTYIHHIRNPFYLDGRQVEQPLSKRGDRLQVGYWSVHGDTETVRDCLRVVQGIDLDVGDVIVSSVASGSVLLEDAEKDNGALIIDIGGGTTDYVMYRKGYIVKTGVVPVGGDHLTNDLSIGLRVGRKMAEKVKLSHGRAVYRNEDRNENIWLHGDLTIGDRQYPLAAITRIIEARISETFKIIKDELTSAELMEPGDIASGVVLTGGCARLRGIEEAAAKAFDLEARVAEGPPDVSEDLRQPEYSTVLGLLHYALMAQEEDADMRRKRSSGFLRNLIRIFNFD
ncbi:MAG: cell division protein FtsA [Opitutales bacterium]